MYKNISKMADQSRPVNPRMHYVVLTMTSSGCLKLYLNPLELFGEGGGNLQLGGKNRVGRLTGNTEFFF